jgi:DNA-binding MarR family transcriptional regulator
MNALAEHLQITLSSATQLIDRLANIRYIKRIQDTKDRRIVRIQLTEIGKNELKKANKSVKQKVNKVLDKIPKTRQKSLISELEYAIEKINVVR